MTVVIRLRKFLNLPGREKKLFLEALWLHIITGLIIKLVPFRYFPHIFSGSVKTEMAYEDQDIAEIKKAIQRASVVSFWKNKCLVSSFAGRIMLTRRRIKSRVCFGLAYDAGRKLKAHAWLLAGETEVVNKTNDFQELYHF